MILTHEETRQLEVLHHSAQRGRLLHEDFRAIEFLQAKKRHLVCTNPKCKWQGKEGQTICRKCCEDLDDWSDYMKNI